MSKENEIESESSIHIEEEDSDSDDNEYNERPCKLTFDTTTKSTKSEIPGDILGGKDCHKFIVDCILALKNEKVILRSPRGKIARGLLEYIEENLAEEKSICDQASSTAQGSMWSSFHILRTDSNLKSAWASMVFPDMLQQESTLVFQLLCDRFLKAMIANKSHSHQQMSIKKPLNISNLKLNTREQNAVRYMAGYVAVSLLNRYKKLNKKSKVDYSYYITVLESMKVNGQDDSVESVEAYTRNWSDLIDRGGLYHIKDEVFELMQTVEIITHSCLSESALSTSQSVHTIDFASKIMEMALESPLVLQIWKSLSLGEHSEELSLSLLREVVDMWISIRGHSFARDWTMNFVSKNKQGLRKTLRKS